MDVEEFKSLALVTLKELDVDVPTREFQIPRYPPGSFTFKKLTRDSRNLVDALGLNVAFAMLYEEKKLSSTKQSVMWKELHATHKEYVCEIEDRERVLILDSGGVIDETREVSDFQLLFDITEKRDNSRILYDLRSKDLSPMTWDVFGQYYGKDAMDELQSTSKLCEFTFDPLKERLDTSGGTWKYNTFVSPEWESKDVNAVLPEDVDFLLSHLFKDKTSREYAEHWLYQSFNSRNQHYLVLNGEQGIGKGLFTTLAMNLVGFRNSNISTGSFLGANFNGSMMRKRLLFMDEEVVTAANKHRLKKYINDFVAFELKSKNASSLEVNHCSFIIANNNVSDVILEGQDRRFAVMELTGTALPEVLSKDKLEAMAASFKDPDSELIAQFGNYLKEKFDVVPAISQVPPKGPTFWKIVKASCREWQKHIITYRDRGEIRLSVVQQAAKEVGLKGFPLNLEKINDFLTNYKDGKGVKLGTTFEKLGEIYISFSNSEVKEAIEGEADLPEIEIYDL